MAFMAAAPAAAAAGGLGMGTATLGAAGISAAAGIGGSLFSSAGQAAANSANISRSIQQDQFNAQQVANANRDNMDFMAQQNLINRDFTHQTNLQNEAFQRETNQWNALQVQKQMDFQERLSNTAYQRAVADMRAAGLNPLLAYQQGGASSMPGASPVAISPKNVAPSYQGQPPFRAYEGRSGYIPQENTQAEIGRAIGNTVSSAMDTLKSMSAIDAIQQTIRESEHRIPGLLQQSPESKERQGLIRNQAAEMKERTFKTAAEIDVAKAMIGAIRATTGKTLSETDLIKIFNSPQGATFMERLFRGLENAAPAMASGTTLDNLPRF